MQHTCLGLICLSLLFQACPARCAGQEQEIPRQEFSRQERLRGSITPERSWWDVKHYDLALEVFPETRTLRGSNAITFESLAPHDKMQIDLQEPLKITRVVYQQRELMFEREGNVYWVLFDHELPVGEHEIRLFYEGKPVESRRPPWSAGLTWKKDEHEHHFIATTCQGTGASIWWPNKDHGYDEPDNGMRIAITVPEDLVAVSNGRLKNTLHDEIAATRTFHWEIVNPINNYAVNMNIGNYVCFSDTYEGESGRLDLEYWVLQHQREVAEEHFREVPRTLAAFEHWFGPYPFYEDSYKLVVVPYLGMEHQSSVTYGNGFQNGYRGSDLSRTGVGLKFDFIIVHESGHEWFGNNITAKDIADMWIHEGFTNYSENLFVNYHFSRKEAEDYVIGCRRLVSNDRPVIGTYNVNRSGSGDMYYKAGNMLHTVRYIIDDDDKWRGILRGLNATFRHQTVTTEQIEAYVSEESGIDFSRLFDQYLRTTMIPTLRYHVDGSTLQYHYEDVVDDFRMPVTLKIDNAEHRLTPTAEVQTLTLDSDITTVTLNRNFYVELESY